MFALLDHVIKFDAPFDFSPQTEEARGFRPTARIVFLALAVVVSIALWTGMIAVVLSFF